MHITLDNVSIEVMVVKKPIKHTYFRFKNDILIITCNNNLSNREIEELTKKNKDSLLKLKNRTPKSDLKDNEIYYLGEKYKIVYDGNSKTYIDGNTIICKDKNELNKYLLNQCKIVFTNRLELLKVQFKNLPKFTLRIRFMTSRWGVCNTNSMTVTLNSELIKKDITLIDYVIIHELCHFKHMDHSPAFWREVEKYYPYHKRARKMLREGQND